MQLEYDFTPPTSYRNHRLGVPTKCAAGEVFTKVHLVEPTDCNQFDLSEANGTEHAACYGQLFSLVILQGHPDQLPLIFQYQGFVPVG